MGAYNHYRLVHAVRVGAADTATERNYQVSIADRSADAGGLLTNMPAASWSQRAWPTFDDADVTRSSASIR
jgi:hypothetical protein